MLKIDFITQHACICVSNNFLKTLKALKGADFKVLFVLNGGVQLAKLELLLKQFVIKLKSEEIAQIVYMIDLINKNYNIA